MLDYIDQGTADVFIGIFYFFAFFFCLKFSFFLCFAFYDVFFMVNEQEKGNDENINIFFHDSTKNVSIKKQKNDNR
jgi:hypothetical protein